MQATLNPYFNFAGNAREAMEFYQSVFGGTLDLQTYRAAHAAQGPDDDEKIMHAHLVAENGITLMAADAPSGTNVEAGSNVQLSINGDDEAEMRGYFAKLSAGGTVTMPLEKAPWGDIFGMCSDRFGVRWLLNIAANE